MLDLSLPRAIIHRRPRSPLNLCDFLPIAPNSGGNGNFSEILDRRSQGESYCDCDLHARWSPFPLTPPSNTKFRTGTERFWLRLAREARCRPALA